MARAAIRWGARALAGMAALLLGYLAAGTIGGLVPRRHLPAAPGGEVTVWVEDNGIHTGIVLPKRAAGIDLTADFPATDLDEPAYARHPFVAVGWGERGFYMGTPTWWDVRPWVVLHAATGSDATVLHVEHVARPLTSGRVRAVRLSTAGYRSLAAYVRASRRTGRPEHGYGANDAFYPARGRYDAVRTCNWWTGAALHAAGVRVGWWTPFPFTVMWWAPA